MAFTSCSGPLGILLALCSLSLPRHRDLFPLSTTGKLSAGDCALPPPQTCRGCPIWACRHQPWEGRQTADRGRDQALPTRELGQHVLAYAAWPGALGAPRKHPDRPRSEALSACPASQGGNVEAAKAGAYLGPQSGPPTWTSRVGLPREGGRHGWSGPLAPCARVPQAWLTSCVQAATLTTPRPSAIPTPSLKGSHVATLAAGSLYEHLLGSLHGSSPLWTILGPAHPRALCPMATPPPSPQQASGWPSHAQLCPDGVSSIGAQSSH